MAQKMIIAFVSTYPPAHCGIGNYTSHLVSALLNPEVPNHPQVHILAERSAHNAPALKPFVTPCWARKGHWVSEILAALDRIRPDLVHFQHEESFFGQDERFIRLLRGIAGRNIPSIVTLHSVYDDQRLLDWIPGRWPASKFHREIARWSRRMVVHQNEAGSATLLRHGVDSGKIITIAHGTMEPFSNDPKAARKQLDLPIDEDIVLFFGFIHPKKGVHTLIKAFHLIRQKGISARLVIAGEPRNRHPLDYLYLRRLQKMMRTGMKEGWLLSRLGHVPANNVKNYFCAADVIALPHNQSYGSSSGVLHLAFAAGKPFICAKGPKFAEAFQSPARSLSPKSESKDEWARALEMLLTDRGMREELSQWSRKRGEETSWPTVAQRHLELYLQEAPSLPSI